MRTARSPDELRHALARAGVGALSAQAVCETGAGGLSELIEELAGQRDPRLVAALPCLIVRHAEAAPSIVGAVAKRLDPADAGRLLLLHRCARALCVSRAPDLTHLFGRSIVVPCAAHEPDELPDPAEDYGERFLAIARERDATGLIGDVEDMFDTWLRQLEVDGGVSSDA
jgi:hypothetical protein